MLPPTFLRYVTIPKAEVCRSFIPTTVRDESQVTPQGATCRVRTGNQLPVLCHCQLGQDIPNTVILENPRTFER